MLEKDKATNRELRQLKTRVEDIESLVDAEGRQTPDDEGNIDIQTVVRNQKELSTGLEKARKDVREAATADTRMLMARIDGLEDQIRKDAAHIKNLIDVFNKLGKPQTILINIVNKYID
jgi:predicted  nucleic acid-binding Zn-ribbon protein